MARELAAQRTILFFFSRDAKVGQCVSVREPRWLFRWLSSNCYRVPHNWKHTSMLFLLLIARGVVAPTGRWTGRDDMHSLREWLRKGEEVGDRCG